jgi:hypothetical protein
MLSWFREHLAPIATWTSIWTVGGAALALFHLVSDSTAATADWSAVLSLPLFFGVVGLFGGLLYHGIGLRGRAPRFLSPFVTALYGAAVGLIPVLAFMSDARQRGATMVNLGRDAVLIIGLSSATALYLRWRDQRRERARLALLDPTPQRFVDELQRRAAERAAT